MPIVAITEKPSPPPLTPTTRASGSLWFALLRVTSAGVGAALLLCLLAEVFNILVGTNFHEVRPGEMYRCAQPTGPQLSSFLHQEHIRTVINLRGCCDPSPWYLDEARVCAANDVSLQDLGFSAGRMPAVDMLRDLVDVLEHCEYPILVHCHRGIDRTGMTMAMALLLRTDCSLDEALYQLGPRYGHLPLGRTGNIDRFFVMYKEYLAAKGIAHSRATFRHWALHEYCPAECRAAIEVLEPVGQPTRVPVGRPFGVRIRCHNTSIKPWNFRPNTDAGIHAIWQLFDTAGKELSMGRSGLFYAEVSPGESIDLTLSLPRLAPGKYQLRLDMKDEQHAFFFQLGEDPVLWDMVAE